MDIKISLRTDDNNEKEFCKIHFLKDNVDIYLSLYEKESFSSDELKYILKKKMESFYNEDDFNIFIYSEKDFDQNIINELKDDFNCEISYQNFKQLRKLERRESKIVLNNEDFKFEKNIDSLKNYKEVSLSLLKKYKKYLISINTYENGNLTNVVSNYIDSNNRTNEGIREFFDKHITEEDKTNYAFYIRPLKKHKNYSQYKTLNDMMEVFLNQKVELFEDIGAFNQREEFSRSKILQLEKGRIEYLKKIQDPQNVVLFTDGGANLLNQASAYIILHDNKKIEQAYAFDKNYKNYEEVALLKGIEKIYSENLNNKFIYIISDYDQNLKLLEAIKNKDIEFAEDESYKNLYYKIFNLYHQNPIKFRFNAIKSHTEEKTFDFELNRHVDYMASIGLNCYIYTTEKERNNFKDLKNNSLKTFNHLELKERFKISKTLNDQKNKDYITNQVLKMETKDVNDFVILSKNVKDEEHIRFLFKTKKSEKIIFDFKNIDDNSFYLNLNQFILNVSKNFGEKKLRCLVSHDSQKHQLFKLFDHLKMEDKIISNLVNKNKIGIANFNSNQHYKTIIGNYNSINEFNEYINKNILKIKTKKERQIEKRSQPLYVNPIVQIDFKDIIGSKNVFPANHHLSNKDLNVFFRKENETINATIFFKNKKYEFVSTQSDYLLDFNKKLIEIDFNKARNIMISYNDNIIKEDLLQTFNREKNLTAVVVKILRKRFKDSNFLMINENEYNNIHSFDWLDKINTKKETKKISNHKLKR